MSNPVKVLYKKVGRKYVPMVVQWNEESGRDQLNTGTFRLTYAYRDGGRRYEYYVTPATAPMVAAMMVAREAMESAIRHASKMHPNTTKPYTKKQKELIDKFRIDMGGMYASWWVEGSAYEISEAAIKAVLEFKP